MRAATYGPAPPVFQGDNATMPIPTRLRRVLNLIACGFLLSISAGCNEPTGLLTVENVYTVPTDIDQSGTEDVTEELLAFFASVPDTSIIIFPDSAEYRIEGTLRLEDRHSLTIEGNGSLFFATVAAPHGVWRLDRARSQWHFIGGSDLVVRNVRVKGASPHAGMSDAAYNADLEAQHGFDIWGVQGLVLDHVEVTDVYGDFVYVSNRRDNGEWSSDILIADSHFDRNGRQGIAIDGSDGVVVENNYIGQTRRASIDLEPYNRLSGMRNITIRNNTFGPGRLMFLAAGSNSEARIEEVLVADNVLKGKTMNVLIRSPEKHPDIRHASIHIRGNTTDKMFGSPVALMRFVGIDGLEVRGNHSPIASTQSRKAVEVTETCSIKISENKFPGAELEAHVTRYAGCS